MKKPLLSVENEIELSILQSELDTLGIKYTVVPADSAVYPKISKGMEPYAYIISEESDLETVSQIIENIHGGNENIDEKIVNSKQEETESWSTAGKIIRIGIVVLIIILSVYQLIWTK